MKKTLTIDLEDAKILYPTAPKNIKKELEEEFGKKLLLGKIIDRINDFADICFEAGTREDVFFSECRLSNLSDDEIAYRQAKLISLVLNEGVKLDYDNGNQKKWFPWFRGGAAGFGFSYSDYGLWITHAHVGSRLGFVSEEISDFAGKKFTSIYKRLNIEN